MLIIDSQCSDKGSDRSIICILASRYLGMLKMSLELGSKFKIIVRVLLWSFMLVGPALILPQVSYAQSEEDILNSIDDELKSEEDKKKQQEEIDKQYNTLKSKAAGLMKGKKFEKAKELYDQMLKLKPDSDFALNQKRLADQQMAEAKEAGIKKEYDALIAAGDKLMGAEKWDEAKLKYEAAAKVKSDEPYPKEKIKSIVKLKAEAEKAKKAAEQKKKYDALIAAADKALDAQSWDAAKAKYKEASAVLPSESYPKSQLTKVDQLAKEAAEKKKQEALDKKYNGIIAAADKLLGAKDWDGAIAKYKEASAVKPSEGYPKTQIKAAETSKKEAAEKKAQAETDAKYNAAIKEADGLLKSKDYNGARSKYKEASAIKPNESYPKEQITKANEQEKAEKDAAAQAETDAKYNAAIKEADGLLKSKDYNGARSKYKEASAIKPNESYPKEQITKANEQEKAEKDAAAQAETDAKYDAAIKAADDLMKAKDYNGARGKYKEASAIKPNESYPKEQIAKANEQEKAEKDAAAQAETDAKYDAAIKAADDLLKAKDYNGARAKYKEASEVKPDESYPKEQITKANEQEKAEKDAAAQAETDAKYDAAIKAADDLLKAKDYNGARAKYKEASAVKPDESYPKEQITKANEQEKAEKDAAAQAETDAKYDAAIKAADDLMKAKDYNGARAKYKEASAVKPDESYPKEQIAKADEQEKAEKDAAAQAETDAKYDAAIASADELFNADDLSGAIAKYKEAASIKPDENYPASQIGKAQKKLADLEQANKDKAAAEQEYSIQLQAGKKALDAKQYEDAIASFEKALAAKPDEAEPKSLIETARSSKKADEEAAKNAEKEAAEVQKIKEEYDKAIAKADEQFVNKEWEKAIGSYTAAAEIKADETYPKEQIAKANKSIEDEKASAADAEKAKQEVEEKFQKLLSDGDQAVDSKEWSKATSFYEEAAALNPASKEPASRLKELEKAKEKWDKEQEKAAEAEQKVEEEYKAAIAKADNALAEKDFKGARDSYEEALQIKANDAYATGKIAEVEQAEQLLANQAEQEKLAKEELEQEYSRLITEAEQKVQEKDYKGAVEAFKKASDLKPEKIGPKERMEDVQQLIKKEEEKKKEEAAAAEEAEKKAAEYNKLIEKADKAFNKENWVDAKSKYQEALALKSEEQYPQDQLAKIEEMIKKAGELEAQKAAEEAAKAEEEKRLAEEEAARKAEEDRVKAEEEEKRKAEEAERMAAEEAARAEEEAQRKAEEEAKRKAAEEAAKAAEEERKRAEAAAKAAADKEARFAELVEEGDFGLDNKQYQSAIEAYEAALEIKPNDSAVQNKLEKARKLAEKDAKRMAERRAKQAAEEKKRREAAERKRKEELAKKRAAKRKIALMNDPKELAKNYPEGITEEKYVEGNRVITRSIIVENGIGRSLLKLDYPWGGKFYYRNGKPIGPNAYLKDKKLHKR